MNDHPIRSIAVSTGGGDAPGLNAVIRAVVLAAEIRGWECWGIRDGYHGLLVPERYGGDGVVRLTRERVSGIAHLGGTILGTTNRGNPLSYPVPRPDGTVVEEDRCDELIAKLAARSIDALVVVGGDGSLGIAYELAKRGLRVVGVPKTIDNDLERTFMTFGFDTAVSFATECLDRLHSTAASHHRIMVVEVMGRYAGWIALHAGIAGNAAAILIPEIPFDLEKVADHIRRREKKGRLYTLVVVAEGARRKGGQVSTVGKVPGQAERLGGVGEKVGRELEDLVGRETRVVVLGHLLRGGSPTSFDRLVALRFGAAAVRALEAGHSSVMVSLEPPHVRYQPLEAAVGRMKVVSLASDTVATARDLGICFGD
ncbi:MAG TPA: ATP-dependent 6-phosphofructokinase [Candidatus Eisenbacteria bacterium]